MALLLSPPSGDIGTVVNAFYPNIGLIATSQIGTGCTRERKSKDELLLLVNGYAAPYSITSKDSISFTINNVVTLTGDTTLQGLIPVTILATHYVDGVKTVLNLSSVFITVTPAPTVTSATANGAVFTITGTNFTPQTIPSLTSTNRTYVSPTTFTLDFSDPASFVALATNPPYRDTSNLLQFTS